MGGKPKTLNRSQMKENCNWAPPWVRNLLLSAARQMYVTKTRTLLAGFSGVMYPHWIQ